MLHSVRNRLLIVTSYFSVACFLFSCASIEELETEAVSLKALGDSPSQPGYGYLCEGSECRLSDPIKELFSERVGFGRETTGGLGGTHCVVNNFGDSGDGTLRQCASMPGPVWITFERSGTVRLDNKIKLPSNSTVDGRGYK